MIKVSKAPALYGMQGTALLCDASEEWEYVRQWNHFVSPGWFSPIFCKYYSTWVFTNMWLDSTVDKDTSFVWVHIV